MKRILLAAALFSFQFVFAQSAIQPLPASLTKYSSDWLVKPSEIRSAVYLSADKKDIVLYNGLVKRVFRVSPNVACTEYSNLITGQQLLRAVKPEAVLKINGREYKVGGLYGQKERAYLLNNWVDQMRSNNEDFQYKGYEVSELKDQFKWTAVGWTSNKRSATGKVLSFTYQLVSLPELIVKVYYEIYDGLPLIVKYLTIDNKSSSSYKIDLVKNEVLAMVEEESAVVGSPAQMKTPQGIYIETNYAFNNAMRYQISDQTTHWLVDSSYTSQVNYYYQTPCVLEVYPDKAPGIELKSGEKFQSVRTYELLMDSYDRERRGLFVRKMYSKVAPWTSSNPIFMHLVSRNDDEVIRAIDQCDSTGYEAVILSFGSHLDMEDQSDKNLSRWKKLADYAHNKGILIGGYSLFSSRRISVEDDVINPVTGKTGGAFLATRHVLEASGDWRTGIRSRISLHIQDLIYGRMMVLTRVIFAHPQHILVIRELTIHNGGRWRCRRNFTGG